MHVSIGDEIALFSCKSHQEKNKQQEDLLTIEYGHHILDFFAYFKYIWLVLDFIYSIILKNSTKIEEFECMEYIHDKIIPITEFEIFNIYFKTKVVDGILKWIFIMVYNIDIHLLNLKQF